MDLRNWNRTQAVLEDWAPRIAEKYESLANLSSPISFTVGDLEITFNLPSYWKYIENGRGPGKFPPPPAIESWIEKKGILPRPIDGITPTTNQLAFLIGRKIAREGTEGKHALERTLTELENNFIRDLYLAVVEDVKNQIV